jgi:arylsulfatase
MSDDRPNIVLVTIDSLRADYCGYIDGDNTATPTLDRLAEEGLAFETAIAPGPSTPESMPAVFTGEYPIDGDENTLAAWRDRIRRHMRTRDPLASRLSRAGYETAAFTPNPFTSRHFAFDQGFDHFQDFIDESHNGVYDRLFEGFLLGNSASSFVRVMINFWRREEVFKSWERYYDEILEWVVEAEEPYFLWVFLMDAHNPYLAGEGYRSQSQWKQFHANYRFWRESHETPFSPSVHDRLRTAYEDAVRYSDGFLARLRSDLADDPIIAVHGDHGEAFGEHETYGHEPYLHAENVHVPLVVGNVPSDAVASPYSLRWLPELVTGLAARKNGIPDRWYAISKSHQEDRLTVRTREWTFLRDGDEAIVQHQNGTETAKSDETGTMQSRVAAAGRGPPDSDSANTERDALSSLGAVAETFAESMRERRRVRDAVASEGER